MGLVEVEMTARQLASHTAGIRHYKKKDDQTDHNDGDDSFPEFYLRQSFPSVEDSLRLFQVAPFPAWSSLRVFDGY